VSGCRECGHPEGTVTPESIGPLLIVACDKCSATEQIHVSPGKKPQLGKFYPPQPGDKFPL